MVMKCFTRPAMPLLGSQKFASDMKVQSAIPQWLGQQPALFFAEVMQKLVHRGVSV